MKKSRGDRAVEQIVNGDVLLTILNESEGALALDVRHVRVHVYPALHLHLLEHRVAQDVEADRTDAAAEMRYEANAKTSSEAGDLNK